MVAKRPLEPTTAQNDDAPGIALQRAFGEAFRMARLKAGLTQKQVSDLAEVEQADVSRIERGTLNITLRTMDKLAKVVDHDAAAMLAGTVRTKSSRRT